MRGSKQIAVGFFAIFVAAAPASVALAQTPTAAYIRPSGPDEITVELPKLGPPMVEEPGPDPVAVVPPGQEDFFADMLGRGASLPGGCTLSGGQIDGQTVRATYNCTGGEVVFELVHPDLAERGATKTKRFAIVLKRGAAPDGLVADVASRIRAREATFEWKWLGTPRSRRSPGWIMVLAAAGFLAIAALLWVIHRARRSR